MAPQRALTAYGVASIDGRPTIVGRRADGLVDLGRCAARDGIPESAALGASTLNQLLSLGPRSWARVAAWADELPPELDAAPLLLPFEVADYVDFYASEHHARNVGRILRPNQDPLPASWPHHPLGYHGRAGTVVVSGTPVVRPSGPRRSASADAPLVGPTERLDVEAELGFVVGVPSTLGKPVPAGSLAEHVFGVCVVNDWSARDIQAWEQHPLGPFLGKSFLTSISPWVVPLALVDLSKLTFELRLNGQVLTRPAFASMHWTPGQLLAHLTCNGASLRTGDLFASGTVSGPTAGEVGCLLELTENGASPVTLEDGSRRTFLEDGDVVEISARTPEIDIGTVVGEVSPAHD